MDSAWGTSSREAGRSLILYTFLVAFYSFPWYILAIWSKPGPPYTLLLMWSPCLAALSTAKIRNIDVAGFGWAWKSNSWIIAGFLIPLCYSSVAYAFVWLTGLGGIDYAHLLDIRDYLGWETAPTWLILIFYLFLLGTCGMIQCVASALGEEIGWRGFMAPQLVELFGFRKASLILGLIWAVWHFPVLIFGLYNNGTRWWYELTCFTALVVSVSFIMTWLRMRSGSLWGCAALHASHNLWIQSLYTPFTKSNGTKTAYAIDEFGFVLPLVVLPLALLAANEYRGRHRSIEV